ncbi:phage tail protein [Crossiella cryophila]|uniref:Phage tail-like protein n=1 Tax=Crossiella cryophila TaxID=43355 RepID=A0A7W7CF02_9PSEU|nr:phage tail protein [Crossiella cryophila]MBB4680005.1 phage tail-like protein [Crossiella cryophila]
MSRGVLPGLASPHPLGELLPAVFQEDEFTMRFTAGLDEVLAPILSTVDNLASYLDPLLAPADFLDWLASWAGVSLEARLPEQRRRHALRTAIELYRWRGTVYGIREHLVALTGHPVRVTDNGGVSGSTTPGTPAPGEPTPWLLIELPTSAADLRDLVDTVVAAVKPAHLPHRVEVVEDDCLP